jgi:hypothetical protein
VYFYRITQRVLLHNLLLCNFYSAIPSTFTIKPTN